MMTLTDALHRVGERLVVQMSNMIMEGDSNG